MALPPSYRHQKHSHFRANRTEEVNSSGETRNTGVFYSTSISGPQRWPPVGPLLRGAVLKSTPFFRPRPSAPVHPSIYPWFRLSSDRARQMCPPTTSSSCELSRHSRFPSPPCASRPTCHPGARVTQTLCHSVQIPQVSNTLISYLCPFFRLSSQNAAALGPSSTASLPVCSSPVF